jgi:hypothetical protein
MTEASTVTSGPQWNFILQSEFYRCTIELQKENKMGRGILLWLLGVPIPVIILLALFMHH